MTFPDKPYQSLQAYLADYLARYTVGMRSISSAALEQAAQILRGCYRAGHWVYVCGNGGSAAISNHFLCDHAKCVRTDTPLLPRVQSLASNLELITAIANDLSYADVFVYQLQGVARPGDVLVTISSSGNSENVTRAIEWARSNGIHTIAMTGFDGGRTARLADVNLHVDGDNYGVIEDAHQSLMHILAQYIRQEAMAEDIVSQRKF
jgi:phosphoheptose isomerase